MRRRLTINLLIYDVSFQEILHLSICVSGPLVPALAPGPNLYLPSLTLNLYLPALANWNRE